MRGVFTELRHVASALVGLCALALAGCASSGAEDTTVKPGSGQVMKDAKKDDPAVTSAMQQQGSAMNAQREKDAAAMAAAQARSGHK